MITTTPRISRESLKNLWEIVTKTTGSLEWSLEGILRRIGSGCWVCRAATTTSSLLNRGENRWANSWQRSSETVSAAGCWCLPRRQRFRDAETSSLGGSLAGCVSTARWIHSIRPASGWRVPAIQSAKPTNNQSTHPLGILLKIKKKLHKNL